MNNRDLSKEEIEKLSYYDFMSYMGTPFFHIGGLKSTERLMELCQITTEKKVLMVGCGTGYTACYVAKKYGCDVVGVDIAEFSIALAKERAKRENLEGKVIFQYGDAYQLPFEPNSFDIVITEFVSQFLEQEKVFNEFVRVLKPGGVVGINEMYKEKEIPPKIFDKISFAEQIFSEITQLPYKLYTPEEWESWFKSVNLHNIKSIKSRKFTATGEMVKAMGGFRSFLRMLRDMLKYTFTSKVLRYRFKQISRGKGILLRKRPSAKFVGYILLVGQKE